MAQVCFQLNFKNQDPALWRAVGEPLNCPNSKPSKSNVLSREHIEQRTFCSFIFCLSFMINTAKLGWRIIGYTFMCVYRLLVICSKKFLEVSTRHKKWSTEGNQRALSSLVLNFFKRLKWWYEGIFVKFTYEHYFESWEIPMRHGIKICKNQTEDSSICKEGPNLTIWKLIMGKFKTKDSDPSPPLQACTDKHTHKATFL